MFIMHRHMTAELLYILKRTPDHSCKFNEWIKTTSNADNINRNCFLTTWNNFSFGCYFMHRYCFNTVFSINLCNRPPEMNWHPPHLNTTFWIKLNSQLTNPVSFSKLTSKSNK